MIYYKRLRVRPLRIRGLRHWELTYLYNALGTWCEGRSVHSFLPDLWVELECMLNADDASTYHE